MGEKDSMGEKDGYPPLPRARVVRFSIVRPSSGSQVVQRTDVGCLPWAVFRRASSFVQSFYLVDITLELQLVLLTDLGESDSLPLLLRPYHLTKRIHRNPGLG